LLPQEAISGGSFWEGFGFGASSHSMVIAAFGSLLGEAILAVNAYRQNKGLPEYYRKRGFWLVRFIVVLGATILPWAQGMKDIGVEPLVPFEIGLCAELLLSRIMSTH
jgi:hypothetical protein